jgi:hypothetical protein
MDTPLVVTELLPPAQERPELSDDHIALYESALDAFIDGRWSEAFALLNRVPPEDQVKDFLTIHIGQHRRQAPTGWGGVVALGSKN